jgi:subtilisin family serine protease
MTKFAFLAVLLAAVACQDPAAPPRVVEAGAFAVSASRAELANDYIVTFARDERDPVGLANALVAAHGGSLKYVYRSALRGFAVADLSDEAVSALDRNPMITRIERDGIATIEGTQIAVPSWGLDRIDAAVGLDASYTYPNGGAGVTAYIIDTGINTGSTDFAGRLSLGPDYVDDGTPEDCHGHGTHVAGTLGGTQYGVAKDVAVVPVRVLNCQGTGSWSAVIAGVDWVTQNHAQRSVANLSLTGNLTSTVNDAVAGAVASGVVMVVAAGNANDDACKYSPASTSTAITVGATTSFDEKWSGSNYGGCLDINAPGAAITSDWIGSPDATATISGTSMASPHVAGAAALYLSVNSTASPTQVAAALTGGATQGRISGLDAATQNLLLYVGFIGSNSPLPLDASFAPAACNGGFSCTFTATATGLTYRWTFGDGGSALGRTVSHNYPKKGGSYLVTLTVSDSQRSASSTQSITCNPKKGCR